MKIGFIGTGNMSGAVIRGMIAAKHTLAANIFCTDADQNKLSAFASETGVTACADNGELVDKVDVVALGVKPHIIGEAIAPLRERLLAKKPLIISFAAVVSLDRLRGYVGPDADLPIIRVMPNVNATVGEGMAAVCANEFASREQVGYVLDIFSSVGVATELAEKDFACFSAIAGSSPAFFYIFVDALARGAVKNGMPKDVATKIAAQAMLGSAKMLLESSQPPWSLVDSVCSPGGMTVAGVMALEEKAFLASVMGAVDVMVKRDKELAGA